jgi:hypothetical protein
MVAPVPTAIEDSEDRMIIRLDPGGPIDLEGLGASFAALARYYARHHGDPGDPDTTPRLFIAKLENGSVIAEIVPYVVMFGQAVPYLQQAMVITNFTSRVVKGIKAFSGDALPASPDAPSREDARDLREFVRPLTGRKGAALQITQARFEKRDGEKSTIVEYRFDEAELNRAALTIDAMLTQPTMLEAPTPDQPATAPRSEVMLFFQQASRSTGKESGRTADKAIIPAISDKSLPVYFQKDAGLKEQMVGGHSNPLTDTTFVVDVDVQEVAGEPKGYMVTHVHRIIEGDD